jgi:hypothetical protein
MRTLLVTLLSTALLLQSQASKSSAADTVKRFYNTYRAQRFSGLPNAAQLSKLAPYLSASLQTLIRAAQKEQDRCEKAAPDEKPPWVEGDMFTSNFEGFTWFQIQNGPDTIVAFEYVDRGHRVAWTDRVMLVQEQGRWVIDDVVYGRTEGFTSGFGKRLREGLAGRGCE